MKTLQSVAGPMEMTHLGFQHACQVAITEMLENPISCDSHLVSLLCEAVRCSRECCEIATSQDKALAAGERKGRIEGLLEAVEYLENAEPSSRAGHLIELNRRLESAVKSK